MNIADELVKHADAIVDLQARLDVLEANSRKASSEQSVVARPEEVESENPALARPVILAELKNWLEEERLKTKETMGTSYRRSGWLECYESVLQRIYELGRGPGTQCLSKRIDTNGLEDNPIGEFH